MRSDSLPPWGWRATGGFAMSLLLLQEQTKVAWERWSATVPVLSKGC